MDETDRKARDQAFKEWCGRDAARRGLTPESLTPGAVTDAVEHWSEALTIWEVAWEAASAAIEHHLHKREDVDPYALRRFSEMSDRPIPKQWLGKSIMDRLEDLERESERDAS